MELLNTKKTLKDVLQRKVEEIIDEVIDRSSIELNMSLLLDNLMKKNEITYWHWVGPDEDIIAEVFIKQEALEVRVVGALNK